MSVLGTVTAAGPDTLFTDTWDHLNPDYAGPIPHSPGSHHYGSPRASVVRHPGKDAQATQMCQVPGRGRCGAGILTGFPFGMLG